MRWSIEFQFALSMTIRPIGEIQSGFLSLKTDNVMLTKDNLSKTY